MKPAIAPKPTPARKKLEANVCETKSLRNRRTPAISMGGMKSGAYHFGATANFRIRDQSDRRPVPPPEIHVNVAPAMHGPSNMTGKIINPVNFGTISRRTSQGMTTRRAPIQERANVRTKYGTTEWLEVHLACGRETSFV